jgi:hypothetical protein
MDNKVNFLWIGNKLSEIGLLSLQSFHNLGYTCVLWYYEDIENVPDFVIEEDANEVMELNNDIYRGYHSDYFRFTLLHRDGGIYSDLDNVLLKRLPDVEYIISGHQINCNSNLLKVPKGSKFTERLLEDIEASGGILNIHQYNGLDLYKTVGELSLGNFIIHSKYIAYFDWSTDLIAPLVYETIDWESLDIYNVHLFESAHRVVYKRTPKYIENMKNLKASIL